MERLQPPSSSEDRHDMHFRMQNRVNFYGPVVFIFAPVVVIGFFVFGVYVFSHWTLFIGQTASIFNWLLLIGAAFCYALLAFCCTKVLKSAAEAVGILGHVFVTTYRALSEAKGQRIRNHLLHAGDNYVVHTDKKGNVIVTPVVQEKVVNNYRHNEVPQLPQTEEEQAVLPSLVKYADIADEIPDGHSLVGIAEHGVVSRERDDIRGLTAIFGGSNTGKSNTVVLRVHEDVCRNHAILAIDPHLYKPDSLARALSSYESHFLYPIAQHTDAALALCEQFLREWQRRKSGGRYDVPWTLVADEVSSMTTDLETEEEKQLARYLKSIARITGQEARGFNMCAILISQNATGLSWIRKNASMVVAHQVLAFSERLLVCNEDRDLARSMNTWPKGRTLIYGLGLEEGPGIYQQPLIRNDVQRYVQAEPYEPEPFIDTEPYEPTIQADVQEVQAVQHLRSEGFNKEKIILNVWNAKKGGSAAYQEASRKYDEIIAMMSEPL